MKIILIVLSVILIGFIIFQVYAINTQSDIETYPYSVEKNFDSFEVRNYEASLFTSVKLSTNQYKEASGKGFSILAGYIFGGNNKNEKIAMTSPVSMSLEDSMTMMFMVPKKYNKETLPEPDQSQIEFREVPPKRVAAISFGGWADDKKIAKHKTALVSALDAKNISYKDKFYFLGYNAPYELFNRRNKVIVELLADTPEAVN